MESSYKKKLKDDRDRLYFSEIRKDADYAGEIARRNYVGQLMGLLNRVVDRSIVDRESDRYERDFWWFNDAHAAIYHAFWLRMVHDDRVRKGLDEYVEKVFTMIDGLIENKYIDTVFVAKFSNAEFRGYKEYRWKKDSWKGVKFYAV